MGGNACFAYLKEQEKQNKGVKQGDWEEGEKEDYMLLASIMRLLSYIPTDLNTSLQCLKILFPLGQFGLINQFLIRMPQWIIHPTNIFWSTGVTVLNVFGLSSTASNIYQRDRKLNVWFLYTVAVMIYCIAVKDGQWPMWHYCTKCSSIQRKNNLPTFDILLNQSLRLFLFVSVLLFLCKCKPVKQEILMPVHKCTDNYLWRCIL